MMPYRFFIIALFTAISIFSQEKPVVVLELFTSQGCSSCPPADRVLHDIKKNLDESQVIPVAYHVDYWNYIGWKDPFSKEKFTKKQGDYGRKFYSSSIYTPQLVINGKEHIVGSNEVTIHKKIKSYLKRKAPNTVKVSDVSKNKNMVTFSYSIEGKIKNRFLEALLVINNRTTAVNRGENRNRILKNANIVVEEKTVRLTEKSGTISLEIPDIVIAEDTLRLVLIVKHENLSVTAGTQLAL
ncbi:DUF1223 domain-containing protein [Tenacibaculum amylolyticum]|uniref:DUF1223 domain-containing protein n=1 Tax=Tenacibaculum amylolyticum TaxID=104269 RepID=UPI003894F7D7